MIASGFGLVNTVEAGMVTQVGPWEVGGGGCHIFLAAATPHQMLPSQHASQSFKCPGSEV